jgi:hypothetical protein
MVDPWAEVQYGEREKPRQVRDHTWCMVDPWAEVRHGASVRKRQCVTNSDLE